MKSNLIYHEMSDPQRQLNHIFDGLEYAHATLCVGIQGEINSDYTVKEVNEIQSNICDHIDKAMQGIVHLLGAYAELKEEIEEPTDYCDRYQRRVSEVNDKTQYDRDPCDKNCEGCESHRKE